MRKIAYLLLTTSLLLSCNKLSDFFPNPLPPTPQFNKVYGGSSEDKGNSITTTLDGGYVMAGYTLSNDGDVKGYHGNIDAWVIKLNKDGNKQWQKTLGGSDNERANSILTTIDGGYVMAGWTSSIDGDLSGIHGNDINSDAWVVKLDKNGNIQWQKTYGGSGGDVAYSITTTLDGGYIIAGQTDSNDGDVKGNHGNGDAWVVKLDKDGNIQWQKPLGGSHFDVANSITTSLDGYVMAGQTNSKDGDVRGTHGTQGFVEDAWIVKLDNSGNMIWQKTLGGSDVDNAVSIKALYDGSSVMAGWTDSNNGDVSGSHGGADGWVVKLDKSGKIVWQKALGGSGTDEFFSLTVALDGGYVMTGWTSSNDGDVKGNHGYLDAWVVKIDKEGNKLWQKTLGGTGEDYATSITTNLDTYVMAGFAASNDGDIKGNHGAYDVWAFTVKE